MEFSNTLFWETDKNAVNKDCNPEYIIEKVLMYGNLNDWYLLIEKFGKDKIIKKALIIRYLDLKTLNFLSCIFNIPKEQFRCYIPTQSTQKHWIY
jgi:hypothetical protein